MKYRIAAASSDGIVVNEHFGRAQNFLILEADGEKNIERIENRTVNPVCNSGEHDEDALAEVVKRLADCRYVLVSRIGRAAEAALERQGIEAYEFPGVIEEAIERLFIEFLYNGL